MLAIAGWAGLEPELGWLMYFMWLFARAATTVTAGQHLPPPFSNLQF